MLFILNTLMLNSVVIQIFFKIEMLWGMYQHLKDVFKNWKTTLMRVLLQKRWIYLPYLFLWRLREIVECFYLIAKIALKVFTQVEDYSQISFQIHCRSCKAYTVVHCSSEDELVSLKTDMPITLPFLSPFISLFEALWLESYLRPSVLIHYQRTGHSASLCPHRLNIFVALGQRIVLIYPCRANRF